MQRNATSLFLNQIAKFWRAGLSGFLLLNLALFHAIALPVTSNHNSPAFSSEIQSVGHSLQRDWQRANLYHGSEISSGGNNDDQPSDAPLLAAAQLQFSATSLAQFYRVAVHHGSSRFAYFLPEPRAAPLA